MTVSGLIPNRIAATLACLAMVLLGHGHTAHSLDQQLVAAAAKMLAADICTDDTHDEISRDCEACRIAQSMSACPRAAVPMRLARPLPQRADIGRDTVFAVQPRSSGPARAPPVPA